jgi:hypothetical protein
MNCAVDSLPSVYFVIRPFYGTFVLSSYTFWNFRLCLDMKMNATPICRWPPLVSLRFVYIPLLATSVAAIRSEYAEGGVSVVASTR